MKPDDRYCRETTVKIMERIRKYPYRRLAVGTRAAIAFYEVLRALIFLRVRRPVLTAALITLPHRMRNESVTESERIVREIIKAAGKSSSARPGNRAGHLDPPVMVQMLRELDGLQDMIHALPYEVDILSPYWFKVAQVSLFKAEAPVLFARTLNGDNKADFDLYRRVLGDLKRKGLIRIGDRAVNLTERGSFIKYKNIFAYIKNAYPLSPLTDKSRLSRSEDDRRYRRGDSYNCLNIRRTLRTLVKKRKDIEGASSADLRVREMTSARQCMVALALDRSWSMARSRKLQYAKDATAGLIYSAGRRGDKIALIAFSDEAEVLSPLTGNYGKLIGQITGLRPANETNVVDTLKKVRMIFRNSPGHFLKYSIIVTDGIPSSNDPDMSRKELENEILSEARKMRKMGIITSVICIRDDLEENDAAVMRKIAAIGKGTFRLVRTRDLLDQVMRDYLETRLREIRN